jgi:hypothetical protein
MTPRSLALVLLAYTVALAVACGLVHRAVGLHAPREPVTITSVWRDGALVARTASPEPPPAAAEGTRVREQVVGEGAMLVDPDLAFAISLVPGRDGVRASLDGKVAYVTPDDLLSRQSFDHGATIAELGLAVGVRTSDVMALLAERLQASAPEVRGRATLTRIRVERTVEGPPAPNAGITAETLTPAVVKDAAFAAARYLARGIDPNGRMRYFVDAPTNKNLGGYDWPRHAGATYFLAQAAHASHEPELAIAALRAAWLLRDKAMVACGEERCIGDDSIVEIGSASLALIAFVEIVRTELDPTFAPQVAELARFLRAQQRKDGEMQHLYDRGARHAIDVQYLYFSGEAALALSRAHLITHDAADLEASKRVLAYLVGPAWSFFGDRYYFGEEHWTCQAMDDLWERAPDPAALDFCVRWHAYGRRMQYGPGDTPFDAAGAFGVGPLVTPRLTPVASRCEAGVATRHALALANGSAPGRSCWRKRCAALDAQLRSSLALLVRQQLRPGAAHLFADPQAVAGAMPGSEVDWQLRIDYAQHAGSAMLRWLEVTAARRD